MSVASFTVLEVAHFRLIARGYERVVFGDHGPSLELHWPDLYQTWDDIAQGRLVGGLELE